MMYMFVLTFITRVIVAYMTYTRVLYEYACLVSGTKIPVVCDCVRVG